MRQDVDYQLRRNMRRVGHLDIPGGGQVVVADGHAYVGHMQPPEGTSIIDVSDPANPRLVSQLTLPDAASHSHKVRVVGDLMYTNVERNHRHFAGLGAEAARDYADGGWRIYDIADKTAPKLITHVKTHGKGVHRFDVDDCYAYMSTEMAGYVGNILVIYDVGDPTAPTEVSRWWIPGQHAAGGEQPTWQGTSHRLHHAMRVGDELWASMWQGGFRVIDVSDIRHPKTVAAHDYHPPFREPTHTIMPLDQTIDGRRIAVVADEEHTHASGSLHAFLWVFDITDYDDIRALSAFDVSEMESPWSRVPGGRFGAHQYREKLDSTLVYVTWFSGGLRVVDVADPRLPVEVAHFIPEPVGGNTCPQSNDVDVDDRGLVYLIDRNRGLDILEMTL